MREIFAQKAKKVYRDFFAWVGRLSHATLAVTAQFERIALYG